MSFWGHLPIVCFQALVTRDTFQLCFFKDWVLKATFQNNKGFGLKIYFQFIFLSSGLKGFLYIYNYFILFLFF
jgi:hypothetical protein